MLEMYEKTMRRMDEIENAGFELHYIWQCEWQKIKREDQKFQYFEQYHFNLGPNIRQRLLSEKDVLDQIFTGDLCTSFSLSQFFLSGEINGFIRLSAKIDESHRDYFDEYPVLFKHAEITKNTLVPKMRKYCEKYGLFETKQKLLISSFFATDVVLSTTYIRFLQSLPGVTFWGVKKIIQFRSSPCLEPFIRAQTERRKEGDRLNNQLIVDHAKAGTNNCFGIINIVPYCHFCFVVVLGYTIMDENRRTQTLYRTEPKFRKIIMTGRPVIDKIEVGPPDQPEELIEVTVRPRKIRHKTPIQIGAEVLQRGNPVVGGVIIPPSRPPIFRFCPPHTSGQVLRTWPAGVGQKGGV